MAKHQRFRGADYGVVTLHRPVNVDEPSQLARLVAALERIAHENGARVPLIPARGRA